MNKYEYKWFRSSSDANSHELHKDNQVIATVTPGGSSTSKMYVEIGDHHLILHRERRLFESSIVIKDEDSENCICHIRSKKWYSSEKGSIDFEDGTTYNWRLQTFPSLKLTIYDVGGTAIATYTMSYGQSYQVITNEQKNMETSIFHLLLVIGWYCFPKLRTLNYAAPHTIIQKLEYAF